MAGIRLLTAVLLALTDTRPSAGGSFRSQVTRPFWAEGRADPGPARLSYIGVPGHRGTPRGRKEEAVGHVTLTLPQSRARAARLSSHTREGSALHTLLAEPVGARRLRRQDFLTVKLPGPLPWELSGPTWWRWQRP